MGNPSEQAANILRKSVTEEVEGAYVKFSERVGELHRVFDELQKNNQTMTPNEMLKLLRAISTMVNHHRRETFDDVLVLKNSVKVLRQLRGEAPQEREARIEEERKEREARRAIEDERKRLNKPL